MAAGSPEPNWEAWKSDTLEVMNAAKAFIEAGDLIDFKEEEAVQQRWNKAKMWLAQWGAGVWI